MVETTFGFINNKKWDLSIEDEPGNRSKVLAQDRKLDDRIVPELGGSTGSCPWSLE